jgi:hypothetical protein
LVFDALFDSGDRAARDRDISIIPLAHLSRKGKLIEQSLTLCGGTRCPRPLESKLRKYLAKIG